MSGVDSFAIELPPVPLQSFDADSGLMPLFDEPILGGFAVPSYAASSVDSIHSSPVGYSPTHAMPSPQTADGMPGMTESSSDELAHARSGIIDKLPPTKKRMAHLEAEVKVEEDSAGSGPGGDGAEGPDDDRTMKRQRRLMKNRESAQLSRQRKKVYVEELEKKVAQLQRSNDDLAKKNAVLTKDNVALREEVVRLAQQLRGGQPRPLSASKSAKAAGVCLLVVLFSFGIIFNSSQRLPFEDSLATARARHIGRTLAQVELKRTAKDNEEEMPAVSHPSVAHIEVKADDVRQAPADAKLRAPIKTNIASIGSIAERAAKLPDAKERRTIIGGEAKDRTSARLAVDSFDPTAFQELKRRKTAVKVFSEPHHVTIEDEDAPAVIQPVGDNHKSQLVPAKNSDLVPLSMEPYHVSLPMGAATRTRPVTQYFFCPEAQRLMPTNGDSHADMPPNYVALLIPGEMLNSTFAPANSLVEVTCSVASMNVYPNYLAPLPEHQDQAALQRVSDDSE